MQVQPAARAFATTNLIAENSLLFPSTTNLATESGATLMKATKSGDVYKGEVQLADLLENIPVSDMDKDGVEGMKADMEGMIRMKERQAQHEVWAYNEYVATLENEAKIAQGK